VRAGTAGAEWNNKTGVAWDSERPYKSKGSQRARWVFEQKTVFHIFRHYDILFSKNSAYHSKENLILILIAIPVFNKLAGNLVLK